MNAEPERTRAIVTVTIVGTFEGGNSKAWADVVARTIASVAEEEASRWLDGVTAVTVLETGGAGPEL